MLGLSSIWLRTGLRARTHTLCHNKKVWAVGPTPNKKARRPSPMPSPAQPQPQRRRERVTAGVSCYPLAAGPSKSMPKRTRAHSPVDAQVKELLSREQRPSAIVRNLPEQWPMRRSLIALRPVKLDTASNRARPRDNKFAISKVLHNSFTNKITLLWQSDIFSYSMAFARR